LRKKSKEVEREGEREVRKKRAQLLDKEQISLEPLPFGSKTNEKLDSA